MTPKTPNGVTEGSRPLFMGPWVTITTFYLSRAKFILVVQTGAIYFFTPAWPQRPQMGSQRGLDHFIWVHECLSRLFTLVVQNQFWSCNLLFDPCMTPRTPNGVREGSRPLFMSPWVSMTTFYFSRAKSILVVQFTFWPLHDPTDPKWGQGGV